MTMIIERIKNLLKSVAPKPLLVYGKATPGTFYPASKPLHDGDFVDLEKIVKRKRGRRIEL